MSQSRLPSPVVSREGRGSSWPRLESRCARPRRAHFVIAPVVDLGRLRGLVARHFLGRGRAAPRPWRGGGLNDDFKKFEEAEIVKYLFFASCPISNYSHSAPPKQGCGTTCCRSGYAEEDASPISHSTRLMRKTLENKADPSGGAECEYLYGPNHEPSWLSVCARPLRDSLRARPSSRPPTD
jgi:hypothetical protein